MTSKEFIDKEFNNNNDKSRCFQSIYKDKYGQIYSYEHHYPLMFKIGNLTFRNNRGYSTTTRKHIGWCQRDYMIDVKLLGCNQYTWSNYENNDKVPYMLNDRVYNNKYTDKKVLKAILNDLNTEFKDIKSQMDSKKRKNTKVYKWLEYNFNKLDNNINIVLNEIVKVK